MNPRFAILIAVVMALLIVAGCSKQEETASMTDSEEMSTEMGSPEMDATPMESTEMESVDTSDMTPQEAEQASNLQREIDRLQVNIAALEVKIAEKSDQARERLAAEVEALRQQQAELEARAGELKTSSADSMRDLLNRVNNSLEVMSRQVEPAPE